MNMANMTMRSGSGTPGGNCSVTDEEIEQEQIVPESTPRKCLWFRSFEGRLKTVRLHRWGLFFEVESHTCPPVSMCWSIQFGDARQSLTQCQITTSSKRCF